VDRAFGIKPHSLTCINICEAETAEAMDLAAKCKTKPDFRLMDAHKLHFPDDTFDVVYGTGNSARPETWAR
jgi:ubiquinone/menaquinone biosynthesis C-methylase UbiE